MAEAPVLALDDLHKSLGGKLVVRGVSFEVARGEIVGLLGPNGAGKSTVISMIASWRMPDRGEVRLFGKRLDQGDAKQLSRVGFLQEKPCLYLEMTARRYLGFFCSIYGVAAAGDKIAEVLEIVGLSAFADRALATFSRGMQQRVCLARCLLHRPDLLVLDEPTLGLDPQGISDIRHLLLQLRLEGVTLLFSSHQLAEMERICDRVVLMQEGGVIAAGAKADLLPFGGDDLVFEVEIAGGAERFETRLRGLPMISDVRVQSYRLLEVSAACLPQSGVDGLRETISRTIAGAGGAVFGIAARTSTLEELFLRLTRVGATRPKDPGRAA